MLFEPDPIVQQIKQLTAFLQAMENAVGATDPPLEDRLEAAYQALLGLDTALADSLAPDALRRMLHHRDQRSALVELVAAHAEMLERKGDLGGALRRWRRAEALLSDVADEKLRARVLRKVSGIGTYRE